MSDIDKDAPAILTDAMKVGINPIAEIAINTDLSSDHVIEGAEVRNSSDMFMGLTQMPGIRKDLMEACRLQESLPLDQRRDFEARLNQNISTLLDGIKHPPSAESLVEGVKAARDAALLTPAGERTGLQTRQIEMPNMNLEEAQALSDALRNANSPLTRASMPGRADGIRLDDLCPPENPVQWRGESPPLPHGQALPSFPFPLPHGIVPAPRDEFEPVLPQPHRSPNFKGTDRDRSA